MPRKARQKSESGIYHIMMRGINRQSIFENDEDYEKFIDTMKRYKWSSFHKYVNKAQLVDQDFLLKMFNEDLHKSIKAFIDYTNEMNDYVCLDMEERNRLSDEEARKIIQKECKVNHAGELQNMEIKIRNHYLRELKQ